MRWFTMGGICIYTSPSGYKVYDNLFFRWLTLDSNLLQTVISKLKPNYPVLYYVPALTLMVRTNPEDCCLLGLGGAGVIHALAPFRHTITAVDNSLEIIEIAHRYFNISTLTNLAFIHQSAELYVEQCTRQYKHILVDLYNAYSFPPECNSDHFFMHCKNKLTTDGFLAVNLASPKEHLPILQLIKQFFTNTLVIPIKKTSNIVIIASNQVDNKQFIDSILASGVIKKVLLVDLWGHVGTM